MKASIWKWLVLIVLVAWSIALVYPPSQKVKLGLDLQGGTSYTLEIDESQLPEGSDIKDARDRALEVIRNRVDGMGVAEPNIYPDGTKRIKYRKVYRGGRMNDPWEVLLSKVGKKEVLDEGIGAELELRGSDDYMTVPAVDELDHCHPCIEEGGKVMLGVTKPSAKNCAKWLVFDAASPWTAEQKAPYLKSDGRIDKDKIAEITPTNDEYTAFQTAYKAKTKECFLFMLNSVKAGKGVYFHCSLGRDRTGTMQILTMGILGVREGDIGKEYELTYFAPVGYSVSSSDRATNPEPIFKNDRTHWVYSDVVPYFWSLSTDGTFYDGVRNYLLSIGVTQAEIDEFRNLMLEDVPAN